MPFSVPSNTMNAADRSAFFPSLAFRDGLCASVVKRSVALNGDNHDDFSSAAASIHSRTATSPAR